MKQYVVTQTIKDGETPGTFVFETKFSIVDRILNEVTNPNELYLAKLGVSESLDIIKCLSLNEKDIKDVLIDSDIFISKEVALRKHIKLELSPFTTLASYVNSSRLLNNHRPHWALPLSYINPTPSFVSPLFNPNAHGNLTGTTRRVNEFINDNFRQVKHTAIVFDGKSLFFTNPTMPDRDINTNLKIPMLRGETLYSLKKDHKHTTYKVISRLCAELDFNTCVYNGDPYNTFEYIVTEPVARKITEIIGCNGSGEFNVLFTLYFNKLNKPVYVMVDKEKLMFGIDVKQPNELRVINNTNPKDIIHTFEGVGCITDLPFYNSIKKIQKACQNSASANKWSEELVEFIPMITESYINWCNDKNIKNTLCKTKDTEEKAKVLSIDEIDKLLDVTENQLNTGEVLTPDAVYYGLVNNFAKDIINNRSLVIVGKRNFGYTDANEPEWEEYMNYRFKNKTFIVFDRNLIPNDFEWIRSVVGECYDISEAGDVELIACTKGFMRGLEKDLTNAYRLDGNDILNAWVRLREERDNSTKVNKDKHNSESLEALNAITELFASIFNLPSHVLKPVTCSCKKDDNDKPKGPLDEIGTSKIITLSNGKEVEVKVLTPEDLERMMCFPDNDTFGTECCRDMEKVTGDKEESRVPRQSKSEDKVLEIIRDKTKDLFIMNTGCTISIDNGNINIESDESFNGDINSLIHGDINYYYIDADHREFKKVKDLLPKELSNSISNSRQTGYLLSVNVFERVIKAAVPINSVDFIRVKGIDVKSALFDSAIAITPKPEEAVKVNDTITVLDNDIVLFFKYKCLKDRETGLKKINNGMQLISVNSEYNTDENMIKFHKVCSDFVRSMGKKAIVDGTYYVSEDFFRSQFKDINIIGYNLFPIELKFDNRL